MAAEVGLALLSASLQVLFDRLASPDVVNFIKGKKLDPKLVHRLKTTLYAVGAVLNDAEDKQIKDVAVKNWLDDLKDAVYVADDFLDELSTKAATQSGKKVNKFSRYLNLADRNLGNKIVDIIERLEDIARHRDILGLNNVVGEKLVSRPQSTSLLEVSDVYGRERDREAIIKLLLSDYTNDSKIGVIPIVGMGGIGKTTLAQLVYNDENVKLKFDLFAWVCVSEEFDVSNITKSVIETITSRPCDKKDLNSLQLDLKEHLKEKKFLIVLDDVWNESYADWHPLMIPFSHGSERSKLIVTTRSERVASMIQTVPFYCLDLLSDEDCWLVFTKHVSPSKNLDADSYLEQNRRDIINKCKGLPFAAKILGGLFRSKPDIKNWDIILKNDIWDLSESENKIVPALRISYHYLPPYLKRCFVHCSLFPKDHEFKRDELILLWMAEDLLQPMGRNKSLEEVGYEYFDDLISRSFFQRSNNQIDGCFVMHDLIHDLAMFFAGKFYSISKIDEESTISEKTRHMSCNMLSNPTDSKFLELETLNRAKALRTFLPFTRWWKLGVSLENAPHMLQVLLNLKCMRVLSLCKFEMLQILPESICELIHLRYLDLSYTNIKMLPGSLCKLHNLQTLKLEACQNLTILPDNTHDLVSLRFLDVRRTPLQEMPRGLGKCKNLHYLSDFIISKDQGARIEELGDLPNLGNRLCIKNLQYVSSGEEASMAKMMDKKHIEGIELIWASDDHMFDSTTESTILDKLQPHRNLRGLLISGFRGTRYPDWLGLQNTTEISLINCKNCCSLPPLGQLPSLEKLEIKGFDGVVSISDEFYKSHTSAFATPFPSLKHLEFSSMPAWQEWCLFDMGAFPQLQVLSLYDCPELLRNLPEHLPSLEILWINKCQQLASLIPKARLIHELKIHTSERVVLEAEEGAISVKNLVIANCKKLEFPNQLSLESLKSLTIDSLSCLLIDAFPNLEQLCVRRCESLNSIVVSQSALQSVTIEDNPNLVSLSGGLAALNMTNLRVFKCPNLKSLPRHMDKLLPNLEELDIRGCPETEWYAKEALPPHLAELYIDHCVFAKYSKEWALPNLTFLHLDGEYDDSSVLCFPMKGLLLPSSLTFLGVENSRRLVTLDCNGFLHLTSLKNLLILNCRKLENIEGERLPPSITVLSILNCPLLERQCGIFDGETWPKISHIPTIRFWWF